MTLVNVDNSYAYVNQGAFTRYILLCDMWTLNISAHVENLKQYHLRYIMAKFG